MTYFARAPLELVPLQPIKPPVLTAPRCEEKPLIVETVVSIEIDKNRSDEASSSQVDKTSNAVIGTTRDEKVNETAKAERAQVPQVCDSREYVEQATTDAPRRQQQPPQSSTSQRSCSSAEFTRTSSQQRTVEQVIVVPDDAEVEAQQRTVEQIVSVATQTTEAATTTPLDRAELDVTQRVTQRVQAKAAPRYKTSLMRGARLELERCRYEQAAQRRFKRARERSAERQRQALQNGLPLEEAASAGASLP